MRDYEMMMIVEPDLDEEKRKKIVEKVEGMIKEKGGNINERVDWGVRKFAYPIRKKEEGHYYIIRFTSEPHVPLEVRKEIRLVKEVFRVMILRQENVSSIKKRRI